MLEVSICRSAVVDAIVGQSRLAVNFHGQANHAGTTPMNLRRDALAGAAEWIVRGRTAWPAPPRTCVATVGRIEVPSGAAT